MTSLDLGLPIKIKTIGKRVGGKYLRSLPLQNPAGIYLNRLQSLFEFERQGRFFDHEGNLSGVFLDAAQTFFQHPVTTASPGSWVVKRDTSLDREMNELLRERGSNPITFDAQVCSRVRTRNRVRPFGLGSYSVLRVLREEC